jgi:hypothetical protein
MWRPKRRRKVDPEQAAATTKEALVALAKRRGYKNPEMWAMKIIMARQRKRFL